MGLKQALRNAVFGLGLALTPACGSSFNSWPEEGEAEEHSDVEVNDLEVRVSQDTTNSEGVAFSGSQAITVRDERNDPLAGVEVNLYQIVNEGDVYLAHTQQNVGNTQENVGGLAAFAGEASPDPFAGTVQPAANLRRYGGSRGRELIIRPVEGLTIFSGSRRNAVYNLLRWVAGNEYDCNGIFTTEELIEQRENNVRLFSFFDHSGLLKTAYNSVRTLIAWGWVEDLPPRKDWYALDAENPLAPSLVIQTDLAEEIYGSRTFRRLEEACSEKVKGGRIKGPVEGLAAYWNFNEGSGNTAVDQSGNGFDGIIEGATYVAGVEGRGLRFNGRDQDVRVPDNPLSDLRGGISLMAWVKPETSSGERAIIDRRDDVRGLGYALRLSSSNRAWFHLSDQDNLSSSTTIPTGSWTHLAATFNFSKTGAVHLYIGGTLDSEGMVSARMTFASVDFYLGRQGNTASAFFDGDIDGVRLYNRELSAAEIQEIYRAR